MIQPAAPGKLSGPNRNRGIVLATVNVLAHIVSPPLVRNKPRRIGPGTITAIKRISILDVIGPRIELRRIGKTFSGSCLFHASKSGRSFTVDPQKNLWHCWACNIGGDAIEFVRRLYDLDFRDAVALLASENAIPLDGRVTPEAEDRIRLKSELGAVEKKIAAILHDAYLEAAGLLNTVTRLRVRAGRRLQELIAGGAPRFPSEEEFCWSALECAVTVLPRLDAQYCLLAFGKNDDRESFCAADPQEREQIINRILEMGVVTNERGYSFEVPR